MGTILRAAAAYCFLFIVLRIIGRRSIAQMTPVELIVIFLFGGITIQAVVNDDRSLVNAFLGVITIGLMHVIVAALKQRYPGVRRWADGTPRVVFDCGIRLRQMDSPAHGRA